MHARVRYAEYLAEVRTRVCGHCPQRVPGRPPFTPACRHCGVELQLPQFVEAVHDAGDGLSELDPAPARAVVCARCHCLDGGTCPCPAEPLRALLVRAIKAVDERLEQWALLHRRLACRRCPERVPVARMIRAYEAATGTCVGCD